MRRLQTSKTSAPTLLTMTHRRLIGWGAASSTMSAFWHLFRLSARRIRAVREVRCAKSFSGLTAFSTTCPSHPVASRFFTSGTVLETNPHSEFGVTESPKAATPNHALQQTALWNERNSIPTYSIFDAFARRSWSLRCHRNRWRILHRLPRHHVWHRRRPGDSHIRGGHIGLRPCRPLSQSQSLHPNPEQRQVSHILRTRWRLSLRSARSVHSMTPESFQSTETSRLNFEVRHWLVAKEALVGCLVCMSFSGSVV